MSWDSERQGANSVVMFALLKRKKKKREKMAKEPEFPPNKQFKRDRANNTIWKAGYVKSAQTSAGNNRPNKIKGCCSTEMSPWLVSSVKTDTDYRRHRTHLCDIIIQGHRVKHQGQALKSQMPRMFLMFRKQKKYTRIIFRPLVI